MITLAVSVVLAKLGTDLIVAKVPGAGTKFVDLGILAGLTVTINALLPSVVALIG